MGKTLAEIAKNLEEAGKKVQLIYAFNGTGKTRLSREFKQQIATSNNGEEGGHADQPELLSRNKILYYNALTEDLFYWDNDLVDNTTHKLKIQPNTFTDWVLKDQGQDQNIITTFQRYTNDKLTPRFNAERVEKDKDGKDITIKAFSEVTFSMERGDATNTSNLKISKGEESNFIWSIFYALLEQVIYTLNEIQPDFPEPTPFDDLEYVFIDDPVSSLDENHLIQLAVDLAELIRLNKTRIKFVIATHNPLFYNVLQNELGSDDKSTSYKAKDFVQYRLDKEDDGTCTLEVQKTDVPFSYHLHLKAELEKAKASGKLDKYHFNYLRNILEKSTIFFGYKRWGELLPQKVDGGPNPYEARMINLRSHSKYSGEEVKELTHDEALVLNRLIEHLDTIFKPDLTDKQPV
jgi:wobble nucleotide-excising tRNase